MYIYDPDFEPRKELQVCMNFYRKLVTQLHIWDLMEFVNYLSARDGVDWAVKQLGRENVDEAILAEIEELDAKLRANADYLINELKLYKHIWRDEPEEYWWWYLDGGKPNGPLEDRETVEQWPVEAAPVAVVAEERKEYQASAEQD